MYVPQEVKDVCSNGVHFKMGESTRVLHKETRSGMPCSEGKDPCMVVKRVENGWLWKCFRCGEKGGVALDLMTPKQIMDITRAVPPELLNNDKPLGPLYLPPDCIAVSPTNVDASRIPMDALHFLLKYRLTAPDFNNLDVHYSPWYKRLIFPIRNTELINPEYINWKLLGWIGRDTNEWLRKQGKGKDYSVPKWLVKRHLPGNMFYHLRNYSCKSTTIVVCEDLISAYRIFKATKLQTLALLGTHVSPALMMRIKSMLDLDGRMVLWLDADALDKSMVYWKKALSLDIPSSYIYTALDPKDYSDTVIKFELNKFLPED